ncbi:MAG TPA: pentapeptide repeat-containing protein, partial [Terriglobales bacterium]|nr:pentapeptide repeat-containing protein [Terriglobales bacterium]
MRGTNLFRAVLKGADLRDADLSHANLNGADLTMATIANSFVYGVSVWDTHLEGAIQSDLLVIGNLEDKNAALRVDNIQMAVVLNLLLTGGGVRNVIDTLTSKIVLILGRFKPERKVVLDAIRQELRQRGYLPVMFDFEKPANRDLTETISLLANMSRFIIADLTDPSSLPHELATV